MIDQYTPELELEHNDRAALALLCVSDGYKVLHRIARTEVSKFILAAINTDSTKVDDVLERHRVAKVAAQLYEGVTEAINLEVSRYKGSSSDKAEPIDITEGILDIGSKATTVEDLNRFEEGEDEF